MNEFNFVDSEHLETLEEYGASLLLSMISLNTLENFHVVAFRKGILDEDEAECSKTIIWELKRLQGLYKTQMQNITERTKDFNEEKVLENLKKMIPDIKIPRKKSQKKK